MPRVRQFGLAPYFSSEMAKYYRACAEEVYIFFREIFRFANEIKKFISLAKSKSETYQNPEKKVKTADDAINR